MDRHRAFLRVNSFFCIGKYTVERLVEALEHSDEDSAIVSNEFGFFADDDL